MRNTIILAPLALLLWACTGSLGDPGEDGVAPPDQEAMCTTIAGPGAPVPMRRLTAIQVERTVRDVLGVDVPLAVTDEKLFTYRSNVSASVDFASARGYLDFAERVAVQADKSACAGGTCGDWLFDDVAARLFRRPLSAEERLRYEAVFEAGQAEDPPEGARWALEAMLQSPSFLYLDEVVRDDGYLDDTSVAARLALALWGQNPDAQLLARAAEGRLSTEDDIRAEATRMLADPRSQGGLHDFVDQWLRLDRLDDPDARPDLAGLGAATIAALREEPVQLFRMVLVDGGDLSQLLTTPRTTSSDALATIYGADILQSTDTRFELDPQKRAGILSLPGVMAALSHATATSPTLRGHAVLANFLCTPPSPPPAGVSVTLPEVGPDATTRERLEAHFSDATCAACHRTMDGMGFAFESFDWLGKSRTEEHGKAIDDTSTFVLAGAEITVDGPVELASKMAGSPAVAECIARQWTSYAGGMPDQEEARCLVEKLATDLAQPEGLRSMIIGMVTSDWFRRGPGVVPEGGSP